ncbi:MAG TPA: hypothetical protein VM031_06735 [Phycisphaerae bacterium]|nr:hypothetical protein [Phycisphaerae bacterium]
MIRRAVILLACGAMLAGPAAAADANSPEKGKKPKDKPASNLDYWLNQAKPAEAGKEPAQAEATNPFGKPKAAFSRNDAFPGVLELSNGKQLPGGLYTTREKPWIVWDEPTKSWRRIPFVTLLSITAVVEQERMDLRWRWKGMGEPEKVFTGKKYPFRRLHWKFKLIDGGVVEGSTKGQPVFVELRGKNYGPFVLHERMKGKDDQTLAGLVYVKKIIISRKMMDAVIADHEKQRKEDKAPAPGRAAGGGKAGRRAG